MLPRTAKRSTTCSISESRARRQHSSHEHLQKNAVQSEHAGGTKHTADRTDERSRAPKGQWIDRGSHLGPVAARVVGRDRERVCHALAQTGEQHRARGCADKQKETQRRQSRQARTAPCEARIALISHRQGSAGSTNKVTPFRSLPKRTVGGGGGDAVRLADNSERSGRGRDHLFAGRRSRGCEADKHSARSGPGHVELRGGILHGLHAERGGRRCNERNHKATSV